jgi:putative Holliday junction resolvase
MGLDIGDSRIGVALSDPMGVLASPMTIINRTDEPADIEAIVALVREHQVGRVIAGLPLSLDGSLSRQTEKAKAFATALSCRLEIPVEFRDERLTTVTVKRLVQGLRKTGRGTRYDAMAAALILQGYLDEDHQLTEPEPLPDQRHTTLP